LFDRKRRGETMKTPAAAWTPPTFEMLRMDAEVGSYQDDSDYERDVPAYVREVDEGERS
jgi:hypothetical protein